MSAKYDGPGFWPFAGVALIIFAFFSGIGSCSYISDQGAVAKMHEWKEIGQSLTNAPKEVTRPKTEL